METGTVPDIERVSEIMSGSRVNAGRRLLQGSGGTGAEVSQAFLTLSDRRRCVHGSLVLDFQQGAENPRVNV